MKKRTLILIAILFLLPYVSCKKSNSGLANLNPKEIFEDADAPVEFIHENRSFHSPWGYEKAENTLKYSLRVSIC